MAYDAKGLRRFSYGGAVGNGADSVRSIWHYVSNDAVAAVAASGYFNSARDDLIVGDVIVASLDVGATAVLRNYIVTAAPASGDVVIAAQNVV